MAEPTNPAESRPPIAPGADAQAPASSARPAPSSKPTGMSEDALKGIMESFEEVAKKQAKVAEAYSKQLKDIGERRKAQEDILQEIEYARVRKEKLTEDQLKAEKEAKKSLKEIAKEEKQILKPLKGVEGVVKGMLDRMEEYKSTITDEKQLKEYQKMTKSLNEALGEAKKGKVDLKQISEDLKIANKFVTSKSNIAKADELAGGMDDKKKGVADLPFLKAMEDTLGSIAEANMSQQDIAKAIEDLAGDEAGLKKLVKTYGENLEKQEDSLVDQLEKLRGKGELADGRNRKVLEEQLAQIKKLRGDYVSAGDKQATIALAQLKKSNEMSEDQRKAERKRLELAEEAKKQGTSPELLELKKDFQEMIGPLKELVGKIDGKKSSLLKYIALFLAWTLGAWIGTIIARVKAMFTLFTGIYNLATKIPFIGKYISMIGSKVGQLAKAVEKGFEIVFGTLKNVFKPISTALGKLKYVQWLFNVIKGFFAGGSGGFLGQMLKAFKSGLGFIKSIPGIGWIITAIFALVDIFKTFKALSGSGDSFVVKLIKGLVVAAINAVTFGFLDFKKVLNFVNNLFKDFPGTLKKLWNDIMDGLQKLFPKIWDGIKKWFGFWAVTVPKFIFKLLVDVQLMVLKFFFVTIPKFLFDVSVSILKFFYVTIPQLLWKGVTWLFGKLWDLTGWLFGMIRKGLSKIPFIGRFFGGGGDDQEKGPSMFERVKNKVTDTFNNVKSVVMKTIKRVISDPVEMLVRGVKMLISTFIDTVKSFLNGYKKVIDTIFDGISSIIRGYFNVGKAILSGIKKIIETFVDGIVSVVKKVHDIAMIPLKVVEKALNRFANLIDKISKSIEGAVVNMFNKIAESTIGKFLGLKAISVDGGGASSGGGSPPKVSKSASADKSLDQMSNEEKANYYEAQYKAAQEGGKASPITLKQLRSKADLYRTLASRAGEIGKSAVSNKVGDAQSGYAQAKETKQAEAQQAAAKPVVANNTTVVNKSSNTTSITPSISRYNPEPTVRGTQLAGMPGLV